MNHIARYSLFFLLVFLALPLAAQLNETPAQDEDIPKGFKHFFQPAPEFDKLRFWGLTATTATAYTGTVIALDQVWYAQYPRSRFHLFNDMGEWNDMDKGGHFLTAYVESQLGFKAYRWTGLERRKAAYAGFAVGTLFQSTLEVLDGFSEEWGFSLGDVGFNTAGSALFLGQELAWQEQRITLKISSWRRPIDGDLMISSSDGMHNYSLVDRRNELYGTSVPNIVLKDYNALTIWASGNIHAFLKNEDTRFPKWLNVAVGYGAENVYGGFSNSWTDDETGATYSLDPIQYERYRQVFLSLDIDLTRIPVKNKALRTLFSIINVIKIPAPTVEFNTQGKVKFHPIYF